MARWFFQLRWIGQADQERRAALAFAIVEQLVDVTASALAAMSQDVFQVHQSRQMFVNLKVTPLRGLTDVSTREPEGVTADVLVFDSLATNS